MEAKTKIRNGYVDVIKFIFALIITEFHLNAGIFLGGRIAVEGFFMISGYLMMCSIKSNKFPNDNLGISTVRFIANKFKGLFPYLLPSILIAALMDMSIYNRTLWAAIKRFPLLLFEVFPLREAGFQGDYVVGISWYLAAMFLALAILYPFCKKYGSNFILTVCPLLVVLIYGTFSHFYGNMAVGTEYLHGVYISSGLLRGLAGCAAGCIIFQICEVLSTRKVNKKGRLLFTAIEILLFAFFCYTMHFKPKSKYDFILIFVIFAFLVIGIGGLSYSSVIFRGKWYNVLGTASTLIVLTHYRINTLLVHEYGKGYIHTSKIWTYIIILVYACVGVWFLGWLIKKAMKKISEIEIWEK